MDSCDFRINGISIMNSFFLRKKKSQNLEQFSWPGKLVLVMAICELLFDNGIGGEGLPFSLWASPMTLFGSSIGCCGQRSRSSVFLGPWI